MIALDDTARRAIDNARALSVTMLDQGWGTVHVSSAECEIFLTRGEGKIDPLSPAAAAPVAAAPVAVVEPTAAAASAPAVEITAPHVASVVSLLAVGTPVQSGQAVATLRVLEDTVEILATCAGTIQAHGAAAGELAEFGARLITLRT